jgi:hypothetical protein
MFQKISFIVVVLFLIVSGGLFAQQNAQELRFGSVVSGNLRSGEEIWYSIRASETCFITVETTGDTDTYLEIYDSQRNLLLEDDDGGNDYNARVDILALRGSSYLVKLKAYGGESGPFRIMSSFTPLSDAVELRLGSIISGNLSSGQKQLYSVRTTQAGLYTVETTGGTDTFLEAYDASFSLIDSDDDGGEDYNARIGVFAEANKVYYFILRGYNSDESGPYRISTSFEAVNTGGANNTSRSAAVTLSLGEAVSVFFTTSDQSRWFVYQASRTVNFVVQTRGNMDTVLCLYDNNGNLLEENDDYSDDSYNALISRRLNAGTYYIEVKTYGGGTGRCTLHAEIR